MYQAEPMQNFNKNNPFVIIAKKKYDEIMDEIQLACRSIIRDSIITSIIEVIFLILQIIELVIFKFNNYLIWCIIILVITDILIANNCQRNLRYFYINHRSMQEFDRLSKMETNDILVLNNEDILNCVQGLYELNGELKATIKYYRYIIRGLIILTSIMILISLLSLYIHLI